jgi:hypothetical protein
MTLLLAVGLKHPSEAQRAQHCSAAACPAIAAHPVVPGLSSALLGDGLPVPRAPGNVRPIATSAAARRRSSLTEECWSGLERACSLHRFPVAQDDGAVHARR